MTNFEKYKDDLMKIEKRRFAFDKNAKKVVGCDSYIQCEDCLFNESGCYEHNKIKWLYEEYKEPVLSDDGLELIKILSKINGKKYKYIYRSGCSVFLFSEKPSMNKWGVRFTNKCNYLIIDDRKDTKKLFSNIKYEDGLYDIENECFIKE